MPEVYQAGVAVVAFFEYALHELHANGFALLVVTLLLLYAVGSQIFELDGRVHERRRDPAP